MKKLVAFTVSLLAAYGATAQADSVRVWNKWCAKKDTMLLFTHGNNQIQIYSRNFKPADVTVKSLDKELRIGTPEVSGDTLNILAMPYATKGKPMRLAVINNKTRKTITTINCYCDSIPKLVARIGNLNAAQAPKKDILAQTVLRANFPKSLYAYPYKITRYTFKVATAAGSATLNVNGSFLTKEVLAEINNAPPGTEILFTNIKATCPECATRPVEDIKIKVL